MRFTACEVGDKATQKNFLSSDYKTQHLDYTFLRAKDPRRNLQVGGTVLKALFIVIKQINSDSNGTREHFQCTERKVKQKLLTCLLNET